MLGLEPARQRLQELSQLSGGRYFAIDLLRGDVLAIISKHAVLLKSADFQKLKDDARTVLLKYGKDSCRMLGDDRWLACDPKLAN